MRVQATDSLTKASAMQLQLMRIKVLATLLAGLDITGYATHREIAEDVDAYASAIVSLVETCLFENEV